MNKRLLAFFSLLVIASMALAACGGGGGAQPDGGEQPGGGETFSPPSDAIGVVAIPAGDPIHIAFWGVLSGPDSTLGEDSKRGVEIAIDDRGGSLLGRSIRLTAEDAGCNAEGGTAAATKLSVDTTIVALIGSSCSGEAAAGVP
ncbi:MAG TPA: ABC transporter substrate-binding protein, partial [Anaerolineales bacterium]|nr:ABC transporter substrate-binding protein [Anaerolineales bacterium]